jgi:hypothetical protein
MCIATRNEFVIDLFDGEYTRRPIEIGQLARQYRIPGSLLDPSVEDIVEDERTCSRQGNAAFVAREFSPCE